jgi:hypothetical protein
LAVIGIVCWAVPVHSQEHNHSGAVGRFYETWMKPENRLQSCCNKQDCAPVRNVRRINGQWVMERESDGEWVIVPDSKIENYAKDNPRDSPDGRSHLCSSATLVFCAVLGDGM